MQKDQYWDELNDDVMADIYDYCRDPPMTDEESGEEFETPPKILIVLDDCISELKGSRYIQDTLTTICANKRHLAGVLRMHRPKDLGHRLSIGGNSIAFGSGLVTWRIVAEGFQEALYPVVELAGTQQNRNQLIFT